MRLARTYDTEDELALRRFGTAVMKYWICKRGPLAAVEALECLGGNGFVEESIMGQFFRDIEIGTVWEGSGNVAALDVMRAAAREPEGLPAFLAECELAAGADRRLDEHLAKLRDELDHARGRGARGRDAPPGRGHGRRLPGEPARSPRSARGRRRLLRVTPERRRARVRHAARGRGRGDDRRPGARGLSAGMRFEGLSVAEARGFAERWLPAWTGNDPERLVSFYAATPSTATPRSPTVSRAATR